MMPGSQLLRGFVHAGGVLQDATVANMSHAQCRGVFAPKVAGLVQMETAMRVAPMSTVLLFSSISSFFGAVGQANYTAANAALDGAAMMRQASGLVGSSAQWGTWSGGGMALRDANTMARAERGGLGVVMPEVGLEVVERVEMVHLGVRRVIRALLGAQIQGEVVVDLA